jgi:hypothetical protein
MMKPLLPLALAASFAFVSATLADDLPVTLMTKPGKLIMSEDFSKPLPPPQGSTAKFASGFLGWRFNVEGRGGHWDVVDGTFKGVENPASKHPATASYGFDFKDVVIQCEVQMHDVPLDGRRSRFFMVRTTDAKDYVCSIILNETGMKIEKDDNDHAGPDVAVPLGFLKTPIPLGQWQKITFEILGEEMVGTLNGKSLTGQHPLIGEQKHSIMFVAGVEGAVRNLKVWEALPNPDWAKNKKTLPVALNLTAPAAATPPAPAAK